MIERYVRARKNIRRAITRYENKHNVKLDQWITLGFELTPASKNVISILFAGLAKDRPELCCGYSVEQHEDEVWLLHDDVAIAYIKLT